MRTALQAAVALNPGTAFPRIPVDGSPRSVKYYTNYKRSFSMCGPRGAAVMGSQQHQRHRHTFALPQRSHRHRLSPSALPDSEATSLNPNSNSMITLGYWKIRGLAAAPRMMLQYAGVEHEDIQYEDAGKWFGEDKPRLIKQNPLVNLPYLVDGDTVLSHSNTIYTYLGDKLGLTPKEEAAKLRDNQALMEVFDIRNALMSLVYPFHKVCRDKAEFESRRTKVLEADLPKSYAKLEALLELFGTPFIGGDAPAPSDFHLFEMIDQHEKMAKDCGTSSPIAPFPKLQALHNKFFEMPQLKKYFDSEDYKLPCNNHLGGAYFV